MGWRSGPSAAEAALPTRIITQRTKEVHFPKVGSERLHEVELAVCALPEQEVAESLLSGGSDDEVGVCLPPGVQVFTDLLGREACGKLLEGPAVPIVGGDDAADGIHDLGTPPVTDSQIHVKAGVARCPILRGAEHPGELRG